MHRRLKITDAIISELRGEIAIGRLRLGSKLPNERELAKQFGVSQPTIREAIRALDAMGLVEVRHGSGVFVAHNIQDFVTNTLKTVVQMERVGMMEALDVRQLLGTHSAMLAVRHATDDNISAIAAAAESCDSAEEVQAMAEAVASFQIAFSAATHNPLLLAIESFLIKLLMQFQLMAEADRGPAFWRKQTSRFADERERLLDRLRARDEEGTVAAMTSYLEKQREWFSSDPKTAKIQLSDPDLVRAADEILLEVNDYRIART